MNIKKLHDTWFTKKKEKKNKKTARNVFEQQKRFYNSLAFKLNLIDTVNWFTNETEHIKTIKNISVTKFIVFLDGFFVKQKIKSHLQSNKKLKNYYIWARNKK